MEQVGLLCLSVRGCERKIALRNAGSTDCAAGQIFTIYAHDSDVIMDLRLIGESASCSTVCVLSVVIHFR